MSRIPIDASSEGDLFDFPLRARRSWGLGKLVYAHPRMEALGVRGMSVDRHRRMVQ